MTVSNKQKCGGTKRDGSGEKCTRPAGWGTDHAGEGKCKLHGGASPIKHGRYSSVTRDALRERIAKFEADPEPLNLEPEVALLRAFIEDLIERWDEIYGPDGALLAWHESFLSGENANPKPRQLPDFSAVTSVVDKVGSMVDRIQKHKSEGSITVATLNRVVEQFGIETVRAVQEVKLDADTSAKLLDAIEQRWATIRLDRSSD